MRRVSFKADVQVSQIPDMQAPPVFLSKRDSQPIKDYDDSNPEDDDSNQEDDDVESNITFDVNAATAQLNRLSFEGRRSSFFMRLMGRRTIREKFFDYLSKDHVSKANNMAIIKGLAVFLDAFTALREDQQLGNAVLLFFVVAKNFEKHNAILYSGANSVVLQSIFEDLLEQFRLSGAKYADEKKDSEIARLFNEVFKISNFDEESQTQLAFCRAFNNPQRQQFSDDFLRDGKKSRQFFGQNKKLEEYSARRGVEGDSLIVSLIKSGIKFENEDGVEERAQAAEVVPKPSLGQIFYAEIFGPDSEILTALCGSLTDAQATLYITSLIKMSRGLHDDKKKNCPASEVALHFMKASDKFFKDHPQLKIDPKSLSDIYEKLFNISITSEDKEDLYVRERYDEIRRYAQREATLICAMAVTKHIEILMPPSRAPQLAQALSLKQSALQLG